MSPFPFMKLPREIRDRVYDFVFPWETIHPVVGREGITYFGAGAFGSEVGLPPNEVLALLSVNHQVAAEAKAHFYSKHAFRGNIPKLLCFLLGIGDRRGLIKSVHVRIIDVGCVLEPAMTHVIEALANLPHLRSIKFDVSGHGGSFIEPAQLDFAKRLFTHLGKRAEVMFHSNILGNVEYQKYMQGRYNVNRGRV